MGIVAQYIFFSKIFLMSDPQPYHHGNLREALVDAACHAVAEHGYETLSLRSLAEEVGVARSAPYRHFPDKEALLAEVARRGFERMREDLTAIHHSTDSPRMKLIATGRAFLQFTQANPQLFRLMYDAQLVHPATPYPELAEGMAGSYHLLEQLYQQYAPTSSVRKRQLRMITLWATLYGYAKVRRDGVLQPYMTSALDDAEIDAAVLDFMIGSE